jgi:hypothetical protein
MRKMKSEKRRKEKRKKIRRFRKNPKKIRAEGKGIFCGIFPGFEHSRG